MIIEDRCRSLIAEMIFIVEGMVMDHKRTSFDKIKRRVLRSEIKRLHKNNFQSIGSNSQTSPNYTSVSNYVSVTDFKPLQGNYSSIKIIDYESHGIKKDLHNMVAKKIEYSSSQLMNKSTFLEKWMIRQPSLDLKPEKYPLSDYAHKKITSYSEDALNSVRKFTFGQFCKFNVKKKQGFFSLTQSDPLKYKKEPISASLTYMQDSDNELALQAFECLLRAGGQAQSIHNYLWEINSLAQMMMQGNDNLKEQIFLQVIKQISSKKEVYIRILCCLCYCIKPSTRIYIPLLNYLYEQATLYQNTPKHLLNYCFFHLIKNFDKGREHVPCLFQFFCAYHGTKVPITVSFPREKVFFVESYTSVEELLAELINYYSLDTHVEYLLEINGFLMERGCLLDNLNYYCEMVSEDEFKWQDYQFFRGLNALIVLKNVNDAITSPRCHSIMYNYCANQYLKGLYSLKSVQVVRIAALKMHSEMDEQENYLFEYSNLMTRRKLRTLNNQEKQNYKKHILKAYFKLGHMNRVEARREILDLLSKNKGFNTHFFRAEVFMEDYDELVAWVGVQKERFIIVQPSTGRIMRTIVYSRVREWGRSKSELCLRVQGAGEFHIESRQVDVLVSVFENYINYYATLMHK